MLKRTVITWEVQRDMQAEVHIMWVELEWVDDVSAEVRGGAAVVQVTVCVCVDGCFGQLVSCGWVFRRWLHQGWMFRWAAHSCWRAVYPGCLPTGPHRAFRLCAMRVGRGI